MRSHRNTNRRGGLKRSQAATEADDALARLIGNLIGNTMSSLGQREARTAIELEGHRIYTDIITAGR